MMVNHRNQKEFRTKKIFEAGPQSKIFNRGKTFRYKKNMTCIKLAISYFRDIIGAILL